MFNWVGLKKLLHVDNQRCNHCYPDAVFLVDLVGREGDLLRGYFCRKCKDYRYKVIDHEEGDHQFFEKVRENRYEIYEDLDNPSIFY